MFMECKTILSDQHCINVRDISTFWKDSDLSITKVMFKGTKEPLSVIIDFDDFCKAVNNFGRKYE